MTWQYLAGEVSLRLAQLEQEAGSQPPVRCLRALRRAAEAGSTGTLAGVIMGALAVSEQLCWGALDRGDVAAFVRQAELSADLGEFGDSAGLL
ncbi:MAG TPA: hypothetical protein VE152_08185 [Acidimicrobiales bacterium]|jgi:hypothetical protein|nr:hypothetical protein [Acidimicrobiales bacterium]